jgi:hypothetical protein
VGLLERLRKIKKIPKDIWESQVLRVFKSLKEVLLKAFIFQKSNKDEEFIVRTNISQFEVKTILFQRKREKSCYYIIFASKSLNKT